MACDTCATGGCSTSTAGCGSSGSCSCNKMNVFDWLSHMHGADQSAKQFNLTEIRFKGGRKEFFRNDKNLELFPGDAVVVEAASGYHLGFISLQGELVRLQMKRKKVAEDSTEVRVIYRKATDKDLEKYREAANREMGTIFRSRQIIDELKLKMKLSDVEYQADNTKATFFYSSDDRVDFRELIKMLAGEFKIRVDMRQISLRQEAARVGGIGVCGRELCCSTWLSDFKNVTTSAARYQNLSLNPAKLSGQCGRLKCCLNYELDTYIDALKDIPQVGKSISTERGTAYHQKTDIFKKTMWFSFAGDSNWYPVPASRVATIMELNQKGEKVLALTDEEEFVLLNPEKPAQINDDLRALDSKFKTTDPKKKKRKKKKPFEGNASQSSENRPERANANASSALPNTNRPPRPPRERRPDNPQQPRTAAPGDASTNNNAAPDPNRPPQRKKLRQRPRPGGPAGPSQATGNE